MTPLLFELDEKLTEPSRIDLGPDHATTRRQVMPEAISTRQRSQYGLAAGGREVLWQEDLNADAVRGLVSARFVAGDSRQLCRDRDGQGFG